MNVNSLVPLPRLTDASSALGGLDGRRDPAHGELPVDGCKAGTHTQTTPRLVQMCKVVAHER